MLTMWIILILFALGNCWWSWKNWAMREEHTNARLEDLAEIAKVKRSAMELFRTAELSAVQQEHKVCATCHRIVVKHSTDEAGVTTCVNCAADRVNGFANGVRISG